MSTTTRAEQFAAQFEAVNDEVIATVQQCSDEQWWRTSASERWPVAVVAHHIAVVNQGFAGMVERLGGGETYSPRTSMEEIHRSNAQHARDYAEVSKPETLEKLQTGGAAVLQALRSLDDEQLDRAAGVFGGRELSVAQVVEMIVIGHTAEHLASIQATVGD